jgi:predicted dehydrogenase
LVGVGFGTRTLLPALLATSACDVVAVSAAHQENADAVARRFGIPLATSDYRRAIELDGVELVCLCAPPVWHAPMIGCALDAGRHIFSTKPLTVDLADARVVAARASDLGIVTAMEFAFRYLPVRRYVRDLVRAGFVGEVRFVSATVFGDFTLQPDHELHYWKWVSSRAAGGGILGASLALHHLDLLRYTFGELADTWGTAATVVREKPVRHPDGAGGSGGTGNGVPTTRPVDSEDAVVLQGRLESKAPFSLAVSWSVPYPSGERLEVYGSDGTLVIEQSGRLFGARHDDPALRELLPPADYALPDVGAVASASAIVPSSPLYVVLAGDLLGAIRGDVEAPLFATFDDGLRAAEIVDRVVHRSADGV